MQTRNAILVLVLAMLTAPVATVPGVIGATGNTTANLGQANSSALTPLERSSTNGSLTTNEHGASEANQTTSPVCQFLEQEPTNITTASLIALTHNTSHDPSSHDSINCPNLALDQAHLTALMEQLNTILDDALDNATATQLDPDENATTTDDAASSSTPCDEAPSPGGVIHIDDCPSTPGVPPVPGPDPIACAQTVIASIKNAIPSDPTIEVPASNQQADLCDVPEPCEGLLPCEDIEDAIPDEVCDLSPSCGLPGIPPDPPCSPSDCIPPPPCDVDCIPPPPCDTDCDELVPDPTEFLPDDPCDGDCSDLIPDDPCNGNCSDLIPDDPCNGDCSDLIPDDPCNGNCSDLIPDDPCNGDCGVDICENGCEPPEVCPDWDCQGYIEDQLDDICQDNCNVHCEEDPDCNEPCLDCNPDPCENGSLPTSACEALEDCLDGPCIPQRECELPATTEAGALPEPVCDALETPCNLTNHPTICDGTIQDPCENGSLPTSACEALEDCLEGSCIPERECELPATTEAGALPEPVCDALETPCNLTNDPTICDGTIQDPCQEGLARSLVCEPVGDLIETCEGRECAERCQTLQDLPEGVGIHEMPVLVCDSVEAVCEAANDCEVPDPCKQGVDCTCATPDDTEPCDQLDPCEEDDETVDCEPVCENPIESGLCGAGADPCDLRDVRWLCVTYAYAGQNATLPLNTPWIAQGAAGEPGVVVWFVGTPVLVPDVTSPTEPTAAGIIGTLVVLPISDASASSEPAPVSVTYEDATFGTLASRLDPTIVSIDARVDMKLIEGATAPTGVRSPVELDPSRLTANVRTVSAVEPGPSVHGAIDDASFSLAYDGPALAWGARIQFETDTAIQDPAAGGDMRMGTRVSVDWDAPARGDLIARVSSVELDVTDMPATVTGAQFLMSDEPANRLWAVDWPSESVMTAITATVDGEELFHAEHPPAAFTASVRVRQDEAPPGPARSTLQAISDATNQWEHIEADVRGHRAGDASQTFGLTVHLGNVTVELEELSENIRASFAYPETQSEKAVLPAFILDAGHPPGMGATGDPVLSKATITVGETATVIVQDLIDAHVDTRQAMNSAERDAFASHVTFGETGLVDVTHYGDPGTRTRFSAASQTVKLSLALTQDDGELGTAHFKVASTGDFDLHLTSGLSTILQLANVQSGTIDFGGETGDLSLVFGDRGYLSFTGNLEFDLGDAVPTLLDLIESGSGDGGGGSPLPTLIAREPEELTFEWDTSVPEGDFAWRLSPFGRLDIENSDFDIRVIPDASEGYDQVDYELNRIDNCDETTNGDPIFLDRNGDSEGRCGATIRGIGLPEQIWFRTIGSGTAGSAATGVMDGM